MQASIQVHYLHLPPLNADDDDFVNGAMNVTANDIAIKATSWVQSCSAIVQTAVMAKPNEMWRYTYTHVVKTENSRSLRHWQ